MNVFDGIDVVERELYSPARNFTLKAHVKTSYSSTKDNRRMDASYFKRYPSKKYSDSPEHTRLDLKFSEFLVLSYSTGEKGSMEEVYMSYPHIPRFRKALRDCCVAVFDEDVWTEGEGNTIFLSPKMDDVYFKVEGLASGKSVLLRPEVLSSADGDAAGAALYLNGTKSRVEIKHDALESLNYFIQRFDLLGTANAMSMIAAIAVAGNALPPPSPSRVIVTAPRRGK
jgi:hypothetical protein